MQITYLGHAGFLVESEKAIVVIDPWLSPEGAFDSGWFQLPRNHDLAPWVRQKLARSDKERFIYLSHEHQDHFDPTFLASLESRDITLVIARFRRKAMRNALRNYRCQRLLVADDGETIPIPGGRLRLFVEDSALNRDSALLVTLEGQNFLNLNDCKIHDRMAKIREEEGAIDVFTSQFSGAIWHPVCYEYEPKLYASISRKKRISKFEAVCRAIEQLQPRWYLASAGPACFLDPSLFAINFEEENIFPRAPKFFEYARKRLRKMEVRLEEPMPGDRLELESGRLEPLGTERIDDANIGAYLRDYAQKMEGHFRARLRNRVPGEIDAIHEKLRSELTRKLQALSLRDRVALPFYIWLEELPGRILRVDFVKGEVVDAPSVPDEQRYTMQVRAADVERVLDRKMTWDEFMLSLRFRLSRIPDQYDAIFHGFLALEAEDLPTLCERIREAEGRPERITVEANGKHYSVKRYCPHQGADLTQGWIEKGCLVCPRHRWAFDLNAGGGCTQNAATIDAREEPDRDSEGPLSRLSGEGGA